MLLVSFASSASRWEWRLRSDLERDAFTTVELSFLWTAIRQIDSGH